MTLDVRALAIPEMKTGFGWILAKPACAMAPFAVTPALAKALADRRTGVGCDADCLGDRTNMRFGIGVPRQRGLVQ